MSQIKLLRDIIHYIITIFLLFGSISNNRNLLYFHLFFCILTITHWMTNNNKCFLSEYDYDENAGYTKQILHFFGFNLNNEYVLNTIAYLCILIPFAITLNKLRLM